MSKLLTNYGSRRPIERCSLKIADRISKRDWAMYGGFANPRLARVTRGRSWAYFYLHR